MVIKILGPGCTKCKKLEENVRTAINKIGISCSLEKVTDMKDILTYGVMMVPALVIDEQVKSEGKVLSPEQIGSHLLNKD